MNISQMYILASIIVLAVIALLIVGVAVALLLKDMIESGVAAATGIVGIGLIAASGRSNIKRMR